jgi:hypothetical protein
MILDRASIGKPRDWRWQRCTEAVQPGGKLRRSPRVVVVCRRSDSPGARRGQPRLLQRRWTDDSGSGIDW